MRDILNSNGINVFVNTISAQEPLEIETDDNTTGTSCFKVVQPSIGFIVTVYSG